MIKLLTQDFCFPWGGGWYCSSPPAGYGSGTGNLLNLGTITNSLMSYVFAIAGIILLLMIVFAGYTLLTSIGNPEAIQKGKSRLTAALVGFILIFAAFWIWQLIQVFIGYQFT